MALQGDVGYGSGSPNTVLRASYSQHDGEWVEAGGGVHGAPTGCARNRSVTAPPPCRPWRFPPPINSRSGDVLELRFGSELQTIQFMGRVTAFRPFRISRSASFAQYRAGISLRHF